MHRKKRGSSTRTTPWNGAVGFYKKPNYAMYRSPREIMPQEYVTTLKYSQFLDLETTTQQYTENYWSPGTLVSGAVPGWLELCSFYARYRVLAMGYDMELTNMNAKPMIVVHGFSTTTGTPNPSMTGNPLWKSTLIPPVYSQGNKIRLKGYASTVTIWGSKQPLFDDQFVGATPSTAPVLRPYAYISSWILSGLQTTPGLRVKVDVSFKIQFQRPFVLSS